MGHFDNNLPVLENSEPEEDLPSCSPRVYISNEEGALLSAMRNLREQSIELRKELENIDARRTGADGGQTPGIAGPVERPRPAQGAGIHPQDDYSRPFTTKSPDRVRSCQ